MANRIRRVQGERVAAREGYGVRAQSARTSPEENVRGRICRDVEEGGRGVRSEICIWMRRAYGTGLVFGDAPTALPKNQHPHVRPDVEANMGHPA